jgi:hypothetical protein
VPRSLFVEQTAPPYSCTSPEVPYFEQNPLLDPPGFPVPGWFANLEIEAAIPHVYKNLANFTNIGATQAGSILLGSAGFDWTVAPRIEFGYRLPSGFGDIAFSYRTMGSDGNGLVPGFTGLIQTHSRVQLDVIDLDYCSREFTPNPLWGMRWTAGLRAMNLYYDTFRTLSGGAALGSGVLDQHGTNRFGAGGVHFGVELMRSLDDSGLFLLARTDAGTMLGRISQSVSQVGVPGIPNTADNGESKVATSQDVGMLSGRLGFDWKPPALANAEFFLGYQYEFWWNVGRVSLNPLSRGELSISGFLLQGRFNY